MESLELKKDDSCENKYLYIVSTISLKKITEDDLKKDFEIFKVKYPFWKNKTFEQYYEFKKELNSHKYHMSQEDNSYFLDLKKAKSCVEKNFADINDGGVYNYVLIKKIPLSLAYAMIYVEELYIFEYEPETSTYIEIPLNKDDESSYIVSTIPCLN